MQILDFFEKSSSNHVYTLLVLLNNSSTFLKEFKTHEDTEWTWHWLLKNSYLFFWVCIPMIFITGTQYVLIDSIPIDIIRSNLLVKYCLLNIHSVTPESNCWFGSSQIQGLYIYQSFSTFDNWLKKHIYILRRGNKEYWLLLSVTDYVSIHGFKSIHSVRRPSRNPSDSSWTLVSQMQSEPVHEWYTSVVQTTIEAVAVVVVVIYLLILIQTKDCKQSWCMRNTPPLCINNRSSSDQCLSLISKSDTNQRLQTGVVRKWKTKATFFFLPNRILN